jgi:hypothetical protein
MDDTLLQLRSEVRGIESNLTEIAVDLAELQGRLSVMPTQVEFVVLVIASFGMALALSLTLGH